MYNIIVFCLPFLRIKKEKGGYFGHLPFPLPVFGPLPSGPVPSPLGIKSLLILYTDKTLN